MNRMFPHNRGKVKTKFPFLVSHTRVHGEFSFVLNEAIKPRQAFGFVEVI